jgi:FkbM family methyltransferase
LITIETDIGPLQYHALEKDTVGVTKTMLATHTWAPPESQFVRDHFHGGTFVDVGAHVGWFTVLAAQLGANLVVAVEPAPANVELLRKNVQAYGTVRVVAAAAWDCYQRLPLHLSASNTGDNRCYGEPDFPGASDTVEAYATTLDSLVVEADFVKIDTQGSDHRVIRGMKRLILECRPTIMMEFSPYHIRAAGDDPREVYARICDLGYTVETLPEGREVTFDGYDDCTLTLTP